MPSQPLLVKFHYQLNVFLIFSSHHQAKVLFIEGLVGCFRTFLHASPAHIIMSSCPCFLILSHQEIAQFNLNL
jgi:hypothetical protein